MKNETNDNLRRVLMAALILFVGLVAGDMFATGRPYMGLLTFSVGIAMIVISVYCFVPHKVGEAH
jgi:hypothetical protein